MPWAALFSGLSVPVFPHHLSQALVGSLFIILLFGHTKRKLFPLISVSYQPKEFSHLCVSVTGKEVLKYPKNGVGNFLKMQTSQIQLPFSKMSLRSLRFEIRCSRRCPLFKFFSLFSKCYIFYGSNWNLMIIFNFFFLCYIIYIIFLTRSLSSKKHTWVVL